MFSLIFAVIVVSGMIANVAPGPSILNVRTL